MPKFDLKSAARRRDFDLPRIPFGYLYGADHSKVRLGYQKTADNVGVWLAALTLHDEIQSATLGAADDPEAPPGALSSRRRRKPLPFRAEEQRMRIAERSAVSLEPGRSTPTSPRERKGTRNAHRRPGRERDAARKAQRAAEARAAGFKLERRFGDFPARVVLQTQLAELSGDRISCKGPFSTYQRPWRPIKHFLNYCSLKAISAATARFSPRMSARFERSASKRNPRRFDSYLALPKAAETVAVPADAAAIDADCRRILVADWRIPRPDISAGEAATVGLLKDLLAVGYEVTFVPTDMQPSPGYQSDIESLGVEVVTRERGYEYAAQFVETEGYRFGAFYLIRMDVVEAILPAARKVSPNARIVFHAPDLYFLREARGAELSGDAQAIADAAATKARELAAMRSADHVVIVSPAELPHLRAEAPRQADYRLPRPLFPSR